MLHVLGQLTGLYLKPRQAGPLVLLVPAATVLPVCTGNR